MAANCNSRGGVAPGRCHALADFPDLPLAASREGTCATAGRPWRKDVRTGAFDRAPQSGHRHQQLVGVWMEGRRKYVGARADLHDLAAEHHRDRICQRPYDSQIVRDEQHRDPVLASKPAQQVDNVSPEPRRPAQREFRRTAAIRARRKVRVRWRRADARPPESWLGKRLT